jgi:hypothetical protein
MVERDTEAGVCRLEQLWVMANYYQLGTRLSLSKRTTTDDGSNSGAHTK